MSTLDRLGRLRALLERVQRNGKVRPTSAQAAVTKREIRAQAFIAPVHSQPPSVSPPDTEDPEDRVSVARMFGELTPDSEALYAPIGAESHGSAMSDEGAAEFEGLATLEDRGASDSDTSSTPAHGTVVELDQLATPKEGLVVDLNVPAAKDVAVERDAIGSVEDGIAVDPDTLAALGDGLEIDSSAPAIPKEPTVIGEQMFQSERDFDPAQIEAGGVAEPPMMEPEPLPQDAPQLEIVEDDFLEGELIEIADGETDEPLVEPLSESMGFQRSGSTVDAFAPTDESPLTPPPESGQEPITDPDRGVLSEIPSDTAVTEQLSERLRAEADFAAELEQTNPHPGGEHGTSVDPTPAPAPPTSAPPTSAPPTFAPQTSAPPTSAPPDKPGSVRAGAPYLKLGRDVGAADDAVEHQTPLAERGPDTVLERDLSDETHSPAAFVPKPAAEAASFISLLDDSLALEL